MSYRIQRNDEGDETTHGEGRVSGWGVFTGDGCRAIVSTYTHAGEGATYRASRSDSRRARMSLVLTGPFTLRMIERLVSSKNSTRTWVTPPREPVRPRT